MKDAFHWASHPNLLQHLNHQRSATPEASKMSIKRQKLEATHNQMKFYVIVAIFCGALAAVKQCDMPTRPVVCPEIYGPVCGTKTDGT